MVQKKRHNWRTNVKYDVVQFDLVNPTSSDIEIDLFDSDDLTDKQTEASDSNPVANQSQLTISGTSPVLTGMGYVPSANYLFTTDGVGLGTRILWDITNNVQISQYNLATGTSLTGNIIQNPNDNTMWGGISGVARLGQNNFTAMTETEHVITDAVSRSGVVYDAATNTIFFGYATTNAIGAFNLNTLTLTDITTTNTFNTFITIDTVNRRIYGAGTGGSNVAEVNIDTLTLVQEVDFAPAGVTIISGLAIDVESGKLFGGALTGGVTPTAGVFDMSAVTYTTILSDTLPAFFKFLNWIITQGKLFIYDDNGATDTITIIDTATNSVLTNQAALGGNASSGSATLVLAPNQALYATKGVGGTADGDLTVLPIPADFYISGSTNYNFFVKSIYTAPKRVFAIEFSIPTIEDMSHEWRIISKDANGEECSIPYLPNNYTTNFQFDGTEAVVDFEGGYIMDINSKARYTIPANTTIIILLWYKEIKRSEKLVDKVDFSKGTNGEAGLVKEVVNQQDQTGEQILGGSGRNVMNYWIPTTMIVDAMVDEGFYPEGWKDMEKMIPEEMIVERE